MATPQTARFSNLLRRMMLVRESAPADLIGDFFPMLDLLAARPEMYLHRKELPFACLFSSAASVGNVDRFWLMNKKPNVLVVVDSVILGTNAAAAIGANLTLTNAGLLVDSAVFVPFGTDTRPGTSGGVIQTMVTAAVENQPAPLGPAFGTVEVPGSNSLLVPLRIVLSTGWAFVVSSGTQNQQFQATFLGYERAVEDISELQT